MSMRMICLFLAILTFLPLTGCINIPGDVNVNVDVDDDDDREQSSIKSGRYWKHFGMEVARDYTKE